MATDRRKQEVLVSRYRPPGVTPLEIWDFPVRGGILGDCAGSPRLGVALCQALTHLHAGQGQTRSGEPAFVSCCGFDTVVLTGGRVDDSLLGDHFSSTPFTTICLGPDPFIGERGGYQLLGSARSTGAVVDVGQTQIKISLANHRFTYSRELDALPVCSVNESERADGRAVDSQRDCLARYIGDSLKHACQSTRLKPSALVVALPCEVDDNVVPGSSSYLGTNGNVDLVPRALHLAGLDNCEATVLNDAELAALSVATSPGILGQTILVITIGFGIGAALLDIRLWKK